jgi:outer membrane protein assembly factor BamB
LTEPAAFRHDPVGRVLPAGRAASGPVAWSSEPAVCGYQRLTYHNDTLGRTIPVPVSASPAVITGVGVLVGSDDGHVRLYDRTLSRIYWQRRLDSAIYASLVVDPARRRVVVAATSGLVTCFDLRGTLSWSARMDTPVFATPLVLPQHDLLVVAAFGGHCSGLALDSGRLVFDRRLPAPWHAAHGGSAAFRDPYASPVATAAGSVIVCAGEHVLCLDPDGSERWRHDTGQAIKASPVSLRATGEVAVNPVDGRCLFLDETTGEPLGEVPIGAKVTASPAVSGRVLAIGTVQDTVVGVDIGTRRPLWRSPQGAPRSYTSFSTLPNGDFIATSSRGNVVCLRRDDGAFRWESSQVLGLPDHEPEIDTTPIAGSDGSMYGGSYTGVLYHLRFRPLDSPQDQEADDHEAGDASRPGPGESRHDRGRPGDDAGQAQGDPGSIGADPGDADRDHRDLQQRRVHLSVSRGQR